MDVRSEVDHLIRGMLRGVGIVIGSVVWLRHDVMAKQARPDVNRRSFYIRLLMAAIRRQLSTQVPAYCTTPITARGYQGLVWGTLSGNLGGVLGLTGCSGRDRR